MIFARKSDTKLETVQVNTVIRSAFEIAKANVDAAQFDVQNAQASLSRAKEDLNKTAIYSPIDGVVTQRISKLGERVSGSSFTQGTEIMTVSDLSVMESRVEVNENDVVSVSELMFTDNDELAGLAAAFARMVAHPGADVGQRVVGQDRLER